jgi:multidrug transporter EmrE-like cation transporter
MAKYIPLILFTVLTNAMAQILLKKGMLVTGTFNFTLQDMAAVAPRLIMNPYLIFGLFTFVVSMASHLLVLSRVELSFAYPFLSLAYIVVAVYSYYGFNEDINAFRMAGIAFICIGTILISRS